MKVSGTRSFLLADQLLNFKIETQLQKVDERTNFKAQFNSI